MSLPTPPVDLEGHCSIIYDNTLYVYTPEKLVSLALEEGAEWEELGQGQSVTDAECTKGVVDGDPDHPALYVVGGKTDATQYSGVQRFSLLDYEWETLEFDIYKPDLLNRVEHAAIFLSSTSSILVFAGTRDGNPNPSTQTFLVSTTSPYGLLSFNSQVPPSNSPLLLPWSEDEAVMVGGGPDNTELYSFSATRQVWEDTEASLKTGLAPRSTVQCAIVSGDDGSKVLEVFDVGASPNTVTRYVLLYPEGEVAPAGKQIGAVSQLESRISGSDNNNSQENRSKKRDLSLSEFPAYDDSNAPSTTREGFSLAQGEDGTVVIAGGQSEGDPVLSVFDMSENSWVDTEQLFLGDSSDSSSSISGTATATSETSSTSSLTSSPTIDEASISTTSSAADDSGGEGGSSGTPTLTIVGATLGAVLGLAAILIVILLFLGWKKKKAKYPGGKPGQGDHDRLSFQDQGMEPLTKSMQPMGRGAPPPSSTDSWALVAHQAEGPNSPRKPPPATFNDFNFGTEKGRSPLRNMESNGLENSLLKETSAAGAGAGAGAAVAGRRNNSNDNNNRLDASRGERLTDEGWAKYFQGNNNSNGNRRSSQDTRSDYGTDSWPHASSAEVPPLKLNTLVNSQPLGSVASGSPSREQLPKFEVAQHQGMTAKISSADSASISSADSNEEYQKDAFSSGVPASIPDESTWSPVRNPFTQDDRVASSNYSDSVYYPPNSPFAGRGQNTDNRVTQWPDHNPFQRDSDARPKGNNRDVSSDVSWLNLGKKR